MNQRIYIEYRVSGVLTEAYSVRLASQDGSYGVKTSSGSVVVSNGTSVTSSSTGIYEYSLSATDGIEYIASWEIVPENGDQAVFATQTAGPFSSVAVTPIRSVPDVRGNFVQGTVGTLFLSLTDVHGNPITAESTSLTISKDGTEIISDVSPDFIKAGFYAFDWSISSDLEVGNYLATWTYTADGYTGAELQEVVISESGDTINSDLNLYGGKISALRTALNEMICCAQKIPVYHEQALPDIYNKKFKLTFPRWNQAYGTRVYRNNKLVEGSYEINYFKGTVIFDNSLSEYDMVHTDYNFRWFDDQQLDRFMFNALAISNFYPPHTGYNIMNVPDTYIPLILYGAAKDAIRELLMCLNFQQPQQVFGGADAAQKAFSNMETLKKNYEEEFTRLLEQKKFGPYPKTRSIVTPEFTLPGGRSRWFNYMFKGS